ncbi:MAG: hypothetical protein KAI47_00360, partial [Deltaproteobacteria bacterium]|nr:hypothetical protein [Deltaproteobacteria bacterium]
MGHAFLQAMGRQTSSRSLLLALLAVAASWTLAAPVFAAPRATGAKQVRSQGGIRRVLRRARVGLALAGRKLSRSHLGRATRHGLRRAAASTAQVGRKLG